MALRIPRRVWWFSGGLTVLLGGALTALFWPHAVAPAPDLASLDANAERGAYLATIGNCASCHSVYGGAAYAGGVAFNTDFGTIYSTNITSDATHGIGAWSFADFYGALKHGLRPDGEHLYPAFPYGYFARLSDNDIAALFAFVRTIPPSAEQPPANRMAFPFGERRLMHFWNRLFHAPAPFVADGTQTAEWNRGAYLVEALAHCGACHAPRNLLGGQNTERALSGGVHSDLVLTGEYQQWSAPNLTPSAIGLGRWSRDQIAAYLQTGQNVHAVVHGPMREVVMESTRHLTSADARAVATYLAALEPVGSGPLWPLNGSNYELGEIVYTVHCGTCHLPDGKGDPTLGVSLAGNVLVQAEDPASLINVILYGPQLPPPPFVVNRSPMRPFGRRLSDEDVAAVATYLRQSFGNAAGSVSADLVAEQR